MSSLTINCQQILSQGTFQRTILLQSSGAFNNPGPGNAQYIYGAPYTNLSISLFRLDGTPELSFFQGLAIQAYLVIYDPITSLGYILTFGQNDPTHPANSQGLCNNSNVPQAGGTTWFGIDAQITDGTNLSSPPNLIVGRTYTMTMCTSFANAQKALSQLNPSSSPSPAPSHSLSGAEIAGIIVLVLVILIGTLAVIFLLVRRRKKSKLIDSRLSVSPSSNQAHSLVPAKPSPSIPTPVSLKSSPSLAPAAASS